MRIDDDALLRAIEALIAATGPLDHRTALEIMVMGHGRLTKFEPRIERGDLGGWDLTYQIDVWGGGRQKCTMDESRLPDRSLDAALGVAETLLPGQWPKLLRSTLERATIDSNLERPELPRQFLLETLMMHKSTHEVALRLFEQQSTSQTARASEA